MKDVINNEIPIIVDLAPFRDVMMSGVCLKRNDRLWVFVLYYEQLKAFTGVVVLSDDVVSRFTYWDEEEQSEVEEDNSSHYADLIQLERIRTIKSTLRYLQKEQLVSINLKKLEGLLFVGKVLAVQGNHLRMKLLNEQAKWVEGEEVFPIDEIWAVEFDGPNTRSLIEKMV